MSGISCNMSVKRELALEIGGMDENFTHGSFREESDFCVRYASRFGRFRFEPEAWIETLSYEIGGLRILPSAERRLHHLRSEMYFIRKNISFPSAILHFACCVYRQWSGERAYGDLRERTAPKSLRQHGERTQSRCLSLSICCLTLYPAGAQAT